MCLKFCTDRAVRTEIKTHMNLNARGQYGRYYYCSTNYNIHTMHSVYCVILRTNRAPHISRLLQKKNENNNNNNKDHCPFMSVEITAFEVDVIPGVIQ